MKTPEQLAEEFSKVNAGTDVGALGCYRQGLYEGYLAGYQAAQGDAHAALEENKVEIDRLHNKLTAAFLAGYQAAAPQWISVKERLPEVLESVLILYAPTNEARNDYRMECWNWPENPVYETQFVTHWMPLPVAPKEAP
jgi:hypothetical protein